MQANHANNIATTVKSTRQGFDGRYGTADLRVIGLKDGAEANCAPTRSGEIRVLVVLDRKAYQQRFDSCRLHDLWGSVCKNICL
jgi:hypothetical protein